MLFKEKRKGENTIMMIDLPDNVNINIERIEDHKRRVEDIIIDLREIGDSIKCVKIKIPIYSYAIPTYPATYQSIPLGTLSLANKEDFIDVVRLADHHVPYHDIIPNPRTGQHAAQCYTTFYCLDKYPIYSMVLSAWTVDTPLLPTQKLKN